MEEATVRECVSACESEEPERDGRRRGQRVSTTVVTININCSSIVA